MTNVNYVDTNVDQLVINKLTTQRFEEEVQDPSETEFYCITDGKFPYSQLSGTPDLSLKQDKTNLVTSVSSASTDEQYPSAKLFYDTIGDIESLLHELNAGDIATALNNINSGS